MLLIKVRMYVEPLNITVVIVVISISYPFPFLLQPCIRSILHSASNALSCMQLFDFKEKALNLHDLTIQMNVSALTGLTGTSIQARYSTAYSWISRIEILLNNQVHDTIYPETQFLLQNLLL